MIFNDLPSFISSTDSLLKQQSLKAVNIHLTIRNWLIGFFIVEFEQHGTDKATYGAKLLPNLAEKLQVQKISNSSVRELRRYRLFYLDYPLLGQEIRLFLSNIPIRGIVFPELETVTTFLDYISEKEPLTIVGTPSPQFKSAIIWAVTPQEIITRLSYSHLSELLEVETEKRDFYQYHCIQGNWSVRELRRQIGSLLYERTALSKNKTELLPQEISSSEEEALILRDPYIFEFLGLKPQEVFTERNLENALIEHLEAFLLELGKGFCFEARQKRIAIDGEHYFVDLVFYHRLLKCHVLIELKTEKFHYTHAGQLNLYLNYFKKYEMAEGDRPPVGILMCTAKDAEHVEFATAGLDSHYL